jgi:glycosyltransferase involved in cell wall biosynthesis
MHTIRWIQYFAQKGHQIHLISSKELMPGSLDNVTFYRISPVIQTRVKFIAYFINTFTNIVKSRKLIRTIKPDIVHAHYLTDYGLLGYFVHPRVYIVTIWGTDILIMPNTSFWLKKMAKFILNSANLITCDSDAVKNECLKYCNCPEKIEVIQWGIDVTKFHVQKQDRMNPPRITVLSTRSAEPNYNIDSIVQSIPFVREKFPDVRFIVKFSVGTQTSEIRKLADSLHVTKNLEIINKFIDYNEFPELLNSADIFISVPSSDSSSVSLHEAMACGLPVIVSDIPANHEWITDGWNGFIVPVRNPEKLAESVIQLIEKPDLMQIFGERNAQIIRERADREHHMAHMENLYQHLIEKYN